LDLTYESAATRLFNEGRTETIRSVSKESKEFVTVFLDPNSTKEAKIAVLARLPFLNLMMGTLTDLYTTFVERI